MVATDAAGGTATDLVTVTVNNVNDAPGLGAALENQVALQGQPFAYDLPAGAFTDIDLDVAGSGEKLTYSATLDGGAPLPGWLSIDPDTGALTGTPDSAADLSVVITATDAAGESVSAPPIAIDVTTSVTPAVPVTIEAEDFTGVDTADNYEVNAFNNASNGQLIRVTQTAFTSEIETQLGGQPNVTTGGAYRIGVTFVDETGPGAPRRRSSSTTWRSASGSSTEPSATRSPRARRREATPSSGTSATSSSTRRWSSARSPSSGSR